jgi:hypothetical protein
LYDFDPQFLGDYKEVMQSLPLIEIPSAALVLALVLYMNTVPRAIDEVTVRLFEARKYEFEPAYHFDWLLSHEIRKRVKSLYLATVANNHCFDEIKSMGGYTAEELAASIAASAVTRSYPQLPAVTPQLPIDRSCSSGCPSGPSECPIPGMDGPLIYFPAGP